MDLWRKLGTPLKGAYRVILRVHRFDSRLDLGYPTINCMKRLTGLTEMVRAIVVDVENHIIIREYCLGCGLKLRRKPRNGRKENQRRIDIEK